MPSRDIKTIFASLGGSVEESISYGVVLGYATSGSIARIVRQFPDWVIPVSFDHLFSPQAFHLRYHLPNVPFVHHTLKPRDFILFLLDIVTYLIELSLVVWKAWGFDDRGSLIEVGKRFTIERSRRRQSGILVHRAPRLFAVVHIL